MSERQEIYRTFVTAITANEMRRQRAATAYLGMTAAVATVAIAIPNVSLILPIAVILVVSLTWLGTVVYFRRLAKAKFTVIDELEAGMEFAAFKREWCHFQNSHRFFKLSLTIFEMVPPAVIAFGSAAYIIFWVVRWAS